MSEKAKKHSKKKHRGLPVPPLSPLDKFLYFIGSVLLVAFIIGILLFRLVVIPRWIAKTDSGIIAITGGAGVLLWTPFLLYIAISGACVLGKGVDCRIPIFGNKRVKYGPPRWGEVYPLFSKNRPASHIEQRPSHVKMRKELRKLWFVGLGIVTVLALFGIFGRVTYDTNGMIRRYNCLNIETKAYSISDVEKAEIFIHRQRGRHRTASYHIALSLKPDKGRSVNFCHGDFTGRNYRDTLMQMLDMKEDLSSIVIQYANLHYLDRLLREDKPTQEEEQLIYEILDIETEGGDKP